MRFLLGSRFWGLEVEDSDMDYVEYVMPTKKDLFNGVLLSEQLLDENGCDVNRKDVRMFLFEAKRGSLRVFELLYQDPETVKNEALKSFNDFTSNVRDSLVEELRVELLKAVTGELGNRCREFTRKKDMKAYVSVMKLDYVLRLLLEYRNPFVELPNHKNEFEKLRELRSLTFNEFLSLNPTVLEDVKCLFEKYNKFDFGAVLKEKPVLDSVQEFLENLVFVNL